MKSFAWAMLNDFPSWRDVENTMSEMTEKGHFNIDKSNALFDQTNYVRTYVSSDKINEWSQKQTSSDQRWVEIMQHFKTHHIAHNEIASIVSYIYCLPGTSATVERIFSLMNNIWSQEKSRLAVPTIQSILYVTYNIDSSCIDFYKTLKSKPDIRRKIMSDHKYHILPIPQLPDEADALNTAENDPIEIDSEASAESVGKSDDQSSAASSGE